MFADVTTQTVLHVRRCYNPDCATCSQMLQLRLCYTFADVTTQTVLHVRRCYNSDCDHYTRFKYIYVSYLQTYFNAAKLTTFENTVAMRQSLLSWAISLPIMLSTLSKHVFILSLIDISDIFSRCFQRRVSYEKQAPVEYLKQAPVEYLKQAPVEYLKQEPVELISKRKTRLFSGETAHCELYHLNMYCLRKPQYWHCRWKGYCENQLTDDSKYIIQEIYRHGTLVKNWLA